MFTALSFTCLHVLRQANRNIEDGVDQNGPESRGRAASKTECPNSPIPRLKPGRSLLQNYFT